MLIGLHYTDGAWRWTGRIDTILPNDDASWAGGYPLEISDKPIGCINYLWSGINNCFDRHDSGYAICEQRFRTVV